MQRLLSALVLALTCAASPLAQAQPGALPAAQTATRVQTGLVVPAPSTPPRQEAESPSAADPANAAPANGEGDREHTTPMVLAALALMVAIALRRWGAGQA